MLFSSTVSFDSSIKAQIGRKLGDYLHVYPLLSKPETPNAVHDNDTTLGNILQHSQPVPELRDASSVHVFRSVDQRDDGLSIPNSVYVSFPTWVSI